MIHPEKHHSALRFLFFATEPAMALSNASPTVPMEGRTPTVSTAKPARILRGLAVFDYKIRTLKGFAMSLDVFISYSRVALPFILGLDKFLESAGVKTWFDKKSLRPGKKWEDVIKDEIENSKIFLTCMSKAGMDKRGFFHVEQNLAAQVALRIPPEQLGSVAKIKK